MRQPEVTQHAMLHEVDADVAVPVKAVATLPALDSLQTQDEAEMVSLLQAAYILLPDRHTRVIQFVGAGGGEGVSTIARRFAMFAANRLPDAVCLLDLDPELSSHVEFFGLDEMADAPTNHDAPRCIYHLSSLGLYIASSTGRDSDHPLELLPQAFERMAQELRRQFSLIIVDSPPLVKSTEALLVSQQADGVVLVIEAEQTTTAAASAARRKIMQAGGKLLGAVLNKRKRRLPHLLTSMLSSQCS